MGNIKDVIDSENQVEQDARAKIKRPSMYSVVVLNDDYTPMDFVIEVLCNIFHMDSDNATETMLTIHYKGKASCGVFTADVAETKVDQVIRFAQEHQHPLMCTIEPV